MQPKDIHLIFYLPTIKGYEDRAHLVGKIADKVAKTILVVSKIGVEPYEADLGTKLKVVKIPKGFHYPGRSTLAASKKIKTLLRNGYFNIVHDTFGHLLPLFLQRHRFPKCLFVTSQYNLSEWDFREFIWVKYGLKSFKNKNIWLWTLRIPLQRLIFCYSNHIILQGPGLVERLIKYINVPRQKIAWLPNNIAEPFKIKNYKELADKCKEKTIRLLFVSSFTPGKGADMLLTLLNRARELNISIQATAVGGFASVSESYMRRRICEMNLEKMLTIHKRIKRKQLNEFYDKSDWLFHLTAVDGSPRVVLEALSRGLPVIGSYHPGIQVIDPGCKFILFSDSYNIDSIIDEMVAAQKDPPSYVNRAAKGQSYVQKHFSSETVSKRYVDLYRQILMASGLTNLVN